MRCKHSVAVTMQRLQSLLRDRAISVFAHIDFSGDAQRAGLSMPPEQLLLFGNPKAGTPLMLAHPEAGLDLPLKALIWEDGSGQTWLGYNEPSYIIQRHALEPSFNANLQAAMPLLHQAAEG
ncbi:MAG: DUF302 domain-containing protein [Sinobacteraceae bacterium]|nr:DUF302 domain-containing protein [Nevskiaceae bacterium]